MQLFIRVISALLAIILLFSTHYLFGTDGLFFLGIGVSLVGVIEFCRIALIPLKAPQQMIVWFAVCAVFLLLATLFESALRLQIWATALVVFFSVSVWLLKSISEVKYLFNLLAISALGLFYSSLLPATTLLVLKASLPWFVAVLAVVFSGDTFAYFGGRLFGKHKLYEALSPQKTIEGALSGGVGSVAAGIICQLYLIPEARLDLIVVTSAIASFLAQSGDLFESLIKRAANIKDSGRIMPGHGGVLDRLDGVFFASPVFLLAYSIQHFFL